MFGNAIRNSTTPQRNNLQVIKNPTAQASELLNSGRNEEARPILELLAKDKNRWAQNQLGYLYSNGLGVPIDRALALQYYQAAAEQGCGASLCSIGIIHCLGLGTPQDYQKAMSCFQEQGCVDAQYNMGWLYSLGLVGETPNYQQAFLCFKAAADENDPDAWYKLGMAYRYGHGVPPNEDEAQACLKKAIECGLSKNNVEDYQQEKLSNALAHLEKQEYPAAFVRLFSLTQDGNEIAQHHLVQLCLVGYITDESNLPIAISILKKAHENGESKAAFMVGKLMTMLPRPFLFGRDELINETLMWFKKAATGEKGADNYAGKAYWEMAILVREEEDCPILISTYLEKAHYQGHPTALNDMRSISRQYAQVFRQKSARDADWRTTLLAENYSRIHLEQSLAKKKLSQLQEQELLKTKFDLEIDKLKKMSTSSLSIEQQEALFDTAQTFIHQDRPDLALPFLLELASNHNALAQCVLAEMHRDGIAMKEINLDQAIAYFKNSFDNGYEEAGFLLVDHYLSQTSKDNHSLLPLAKELVEKMVDAHLFIDKRMDKKKVEGLFYPQPRISGMVKDWYEISPFYLKAALKMAKIRYIENPSSTKDMQALEQEIMSSADKHTQLELIEWCLTRPKADKDKATDLVKTMIESIKVIKVPNAYPKTRELIYEIKR